MIEAAPQTPVKFCNLIGGEWFVIVEADGKICPTLYRKSNDDTALGLFTEERDAVEILNSNCKIPADMPVYIVDSIVKIVVKLQE